MYLRTPCAALIWCHTSTDWCKECTRPQQLNEVLYRIIYLVNFIHSFHWHVQNATVPCHSLELHPFLSVIYPFLAPFCTNYSSILLHFILPSVCWSTLLSPNSYIIPFWEFYFLPFSVDVQPNIVYLTLLSLLWWVF